MQEVEYTHKVKYESGVIVMWKDNERTKEYKPLIKAVGAVGMKVAALKPF